ncbi:hypothetical protein Hanom_Chr12g01069001 [Helianthus anomalus]
MNKQTHTGGVWSQILHQAWARVTITRLIVPIDKELASGHAGMREPGLFSHSRKDENLTLCMRMVVFGNIHGMQ